MGEVALDAVADLLSVGPGDSALDACGILLLRSLAAPALCAEPEFCVPTVLAPGRGP